ncbi:MAG: TfoX/Sxy family protein [Coriobacteriia bacterium]
MELTDLPNVGKVLAANLAAVGITTPAELQEVGAKDAFLRIRAQVDPGACLHMLYGIAGAIEGIPDNRLSEETKAELKAFFWTL